MNYGFGEASFEYFELCNLSCENTNIHVACLCNLNVNMIDNEKYQSARQNMKFMTRSLCLLANKLHILARQADIFDHP
jgi:hypothetical protein